VAGEESGDGSSAEALRAEGDAAADSDEHEAQALVAEKRNLAAAGTANTRVVLWLTRISEAAQRLSRNLSGSAIELAMGSTKPMPSKA